MLPIFDSHETRIARHAQVAQDSGIVSVNVSVILVRNGQLMLEVTKEVEPMVQLNGFFPSRSEWEGLGFPVGGMVREFRSSASVSAVAAPFKEGENRWA